MSPAETLSRPALSASQCFAFAKHSPACALAQAAPSSQEGASPCYKYAMTVIFNKHKHLDRRRTLRNEMTAAEQALWIAIRCDKLGARFRRQYGVGAFILDFYCPKYRLAIEVDGEVHEQQKQKEIDKERQLIIEHLGIKFLRFTNRQVLHKLPVVLKTIKAELKACILAPSSEEGAAGRPGSVSAGDIAKRQRSGRVLAA